MSSLPSHCQLLSRGTFVIEMYFASCYSLYFYKVLIKNKGFFFIHKPYSNFSINKKINSLCYIISSTELCMNRIRSYYIVVVKRRREAVSWYIFSTFYWTKHVQKVHKCCYDLIIFHIWTYHLYQNQDQERRYYQYLKISTYAFLLYLPNPSK